jgi:hypothetical protein
MLALSGCAGNICLETGCADQVYATVTSADGSFPSGTHRVEVLADGVTRTCTFTFPLATGAGGHDVQPTCGNGLSVGVYPQLACGGDACQPIPGKFEEIITVDGTPAQVHAWQYVDDVAILDAAAAPSYRGARTSPDCPPACQTASVTWTLQ